MRLFVAIPLAAEVVHELSACTARLKSGHDGLRWSEQESWHITLQFLGDTRAEQYASLVARLAEVTSPPVPVYVEDLGVFERAAIFHAGVRLTLPLIALQRSVVAATSQCGFVPESRPYQPHITLARGRRGTRSHALHGLESKIARQPAFSAFVAREFLLYESHLSHSGSRYQVLQRFALTGSAGVT
jgi:2'-5' RNA ligase